MVLNQAVVDGVQNWIDQIRKLCPGDAVKYELVELCQLGDALEICAASIEHFEVGLDRVAYELRLRNVLLLCALDD
jgi:hypothetical protein